MVEKGHAADRQLLLARANQGDRQHQLGNHEGKRRWGMCSRAEDAEEDRGAILQARGVEVGTKGGGGTSGAVGGDGWDKGRAEM